MEKKTIGIIIISLSVVLLLTGAWKLGYFNNKYVWYGLISVSFVAILSTILIFLNVRKNYNSKPVKDSAFYFDRVNSLLMKRTAGDSIDWSGGQYTKFKRKMFTDNANKEHEFLGIVGRLKNYMKEVVVIYNVEKDDVEEYHPEPSPEQILNPFRGFDPYNKQSSSMPFNPYMFGGKGGKYPSRFQMGGGDGGVNINVGSAQESKSLGQRASEVMREFETKND